MREDRKTVKGGIDRDECRKARQNQKVELRKAKKDDVMQKRRNMFVQPEGADDDIDVTPPESSDLPALASTMTSFIQDGCPEENANSAYLAVKALRKLLSIEVNPPIDAVIAAGLVPVFVSLLGSNSQQMCFEAAWCVTNIASGNSAQCDNVVQHGAVQALVMLLHHPVLEVKEQAVWALGNIAGDTARLRDFVIAQCGVPRLLELVDSLAANAQLGALRNATWALSNLMRGKPQPDASQVLPAVATFSRLLQLGDEELTADCCWALSYVTDGDNELINAVCQADAVPQLMQLLMKSERIQTPAMRTLCNMLSGSDDATQIVIDGGFLTVLPHALKAVKARTRKEACWAISNIAAGTRAQVESLMAMRELLAEVIERLDVDEWEVKKEAMWCVANILHGFKQSPCAHTASRAFTLFQLGALKPMVRMLSINDVTVQKMVLEAISNLLGAGEQLSRANPMKQGENPFLVPFDEADGLDNLERLQEHPNTEVYSRAVEILETYFGEEDDVEDENLAPHKQAGAFCFNAPTQAAKPLGEVNTPLTPPRFVF